MRRQIIIITLCSLLPTAYATTNPSFDCKKASTKIEKTICADPKLAELDRKLAEQVKQIIHASPENATVFLGYQKAWLKLRNECNESKYGCENEDIYKIMQSRIEQLTNTFNWYHNSQWVNFISAPSVSFFGDDKKNYLAMLNKMYNGTNLGGRSDDFRLVPPTPDNTTMTDKQKNLWQIKNSVSINSCATLEEKKTKNFEKYNLLAVTVDGDDDNKFCGTTSCEYAIASFVSTCEVIKELMKVKPTTERPFKAFSFSPQSIPDINHDDDYAGSIIDFVDYSKNSKTEFEQYVPYEIKATLVKNDGEDVNTSSTTVTVIGRGDFIGDSREQLLINYSTFDDLATPSSVDSYYLLEKNSDGRFQIVQLL